MLVALATRLDRRRWRPSVICLDRAGPLADTLLGAGLEVNCLAASPRRPLRAVARLACALRRRSPRLVQSFLFHANLAARLAAPMAGVPWVIGGLRVAEHRKGWHRTLERLSARLSAGSVCVSRGVERFSRDVVGIAADRLTTIPNGVDLDPFDRSGAGARAGPIDRASRIGVPPVGPLFGRHRPGSTLRKGLPFLLEAAERSDRPVGIATGISSWPATAPIASLAPGASRPGIPALAGQAPLARPSRRHPGACSGIADLVVLAVALGGDAERGPGSDGGPSRRGGHGGRGERGPGDPRPDRLARSPPETRPHWPVPCSRPPTTPTAANASAPPVARGSRPSSPLTAWSRPMNASGPGSSGWIGKVDARRPSKSLPLWARSPVTLD